MQITVVNVSVEDKGKYKMAEVFYKDGSGKASSKKLMSFGAGEPAFKVLSQAQAGTSFEVTAQKNDKGYWDWVAVAPAGQAAPASAGGSGGNPSPRSTYETAEERAARQLLIVRQSSVSNAIEYYGLNSKKTPSVEEVLLVARQFEDFVFGKNSEKAAGITDLADDIPY